MLSRLNACLQHDACAGNRAFAPVQKQAAPHLQVESQPMYVQTTPMTNVLTAHQVVMYASDAPHSARSTQPESLRSLVSL